MKLTPKIIPIDLRRRRELARAHAPEAKTALAAFRLGDTGYKPQRLDWPKSREPQQRVVALKLPTRTLEGEAS